MSLELISFKLCPFVQRAVITLNYKQTPFNIRYIDINDPPEWFLKLSPTGKVPVLKVDNTVLFESAVINEYIDETTPPSLHPDDPLKKAQNRAWIEYGSELFGINFQISNAQTEEEIKDLMGLLVGKLERIEEVSAFNPYFNGDRFSLVDTSFVPLLMRLDLINRIYPIPGFEDLKGILRWWDALKEMDAVKQSIVDDFESLFYGRLSSSGSFIGKQVTVG